MTRVKICGLSRPQDVDAVNRAGADYAGFVFAASKRQVTPAQAQRLRARLQPGILPVGVFVNAPVQAVLALLEQGCIQIAQLHGDENDDYIMQIQQAGYPVIKAFRIASQLDIARARACAADFLLLDSGAGTGRAFDWGLIQGLSRPWFLAGGLEPANVQQAVQQLHPWAVDVSSGVESGGAKDPRKIEELVWRAHNG